MRGRSFWTGRRCKGRQQGNEGASLRKAHGKTVAMRDGWVRTLGKNRKKIASIAAWGLLALVSAEWAQAQTAEQAWLHYPLKRTVHIFFPASVRALGSSP